MKTSWLAVLVSVALFMGAGMANAGLTDGLVAYYPFNGSADDATGNGYHGVIHGATAVDNRFGYTNAAFQFDGANDYIELNNLPVTQSFSVVLWVKSGNEKWNTDGFILSTGDTNGYAIRPVQNSLNWSGYVIGADGTENWIGSHTPEDITEFHQYAITYNSSSFVACMFFDGKLAAASTFDGLERKTGTSIDLLVGKDVETQYRFGKCVIDDIRFYNRVLSETEIKQLYLGGGEIASCCFCPTSTTDCSQCEPQCQPCGGSQNDDCFFIKSDLSIPFSCISYNNKDYSLTLEFNLTTSGWTIRSGSVSILP